MRDFLTPHERESLEETIKRALKAAGCPAAKINPVSFELVERISSDPEIARWYLDQTRKPH